MALCWPNRNRRSRQPDPGRGAASRTGAGARQGPLGAVNGSLINGLRTPQVVAHLSARRPKRALPQADPVPNRPLVLLCCEIATVFCYRRRHCRSAVSYLQRRQPRTRFDGRPSPASGRARNGSRRDRARDLMPVVVQRLAPAAWRARLTPRPRRMLRWLQTLVTRASVMTER